MAYAAHQAARFVEQPKKEHGEAVTWLGKYILGTIGNGMILKPRNDEGLEVFVDADFAGNWDPLDTDNRDTNGRDTDRSDADRHDTDTGV